MENKKHSFIPFFLTIFIDQLGWGIVIPVLGPIFLNRYSGILPVSASFATRSIFLSLLMGSYSLAQFFGAPILGGLSDRYGRRKILLISLIGTLIGYLLFGVGIVKMDLWLLFISRILSGFTGGNISTILSAIADVSNEKTKVKNFGLAGTAYASGLILGPYLGGKLADPSFVSWFNFATPFWFASLIILLNIIIAIGVFHETLKTQIRTKISFFTGFKNIHKAFLLSNVRIVFIVIFLLTFVFAFFIQFFQIYAVEKFGLNQSELGDLFAYIGLWVVFTQAILARTLAKKYSPNIILIVSILALALAFPVLLVPNQTLVLLGVLPFIAVTSGIILPNVTTVISNLSSSDSQGEIMGINQSIQSLSQAIPPIIAGLIVSINVTYPILVSSLLTFLAWLIFLYFFKSQKEEIFVEE